jgi:hypothetical protein
MLKWINHEIGYPINLTRRQVFHLFYYSQLPLVIIAMVLTGSISVVLYGLINWQAVLLVGLSTFFTYSVDNLIDWKKDRAHYQTIAPMAKICHRISYILIPASAIAVILLILNSLENLRIGVLLLGASVAIGVTRFSSYRSGTPTNSNGVVDFILNRFFISLIWTIVCVFIPIWYNQNPGTTKNNPHLHLYVHADWDLCCDLEI